VEIYQEFTFDAGPPLSRGSRSHPYHGLHGHSFARASCSRVASIRRRDSSLNLGEVEARCKALRERLDHKYLNDVDGLKVPSLENIAVWIWENLKPELPPLARVEVRRESCRHGCVYAGN